MDEHDKQFESYLRQFRLRKPGPLPEIASLSRRSSMRWLLAAAAVVLIAGLSVLFIRKDGSNSGPKASVEAAGNPSLYRVGETIEAGKVVRSNSAVGLLLALEDGSRVEMREQSELKLESAADGIRVRLNSGSILVTAAKQGSGHLYVQTRDALVSVVGTVFLVNAEQSGTTVAVVEGEVHVQQGAESKKLLPGEHVTTDPSIKPKTVAEEISWSRSAKEYVVLLEQSTGQILELQALEAQGNPSPGIPADANPQPAGAIGKNSLALFRMAEARFESGDINTAVQLFRDSLNGDLKPKWLEVWAHINIGKIYDIRGGQRDRAISEYQKAVNTGDDTYSAQGEAKKYMGVPFQLSQPTQQAIEVPYPSLTPAALAAQQTAALARAQSEPPRISSGKQILDRVCTSCHSTDVAMNMERHGAPLSSLDRDLLSMRRAEIAQLLSRGLKKNHPDVVRLQSLIDELEAREIGVAGNYRSFVSRHLAGLGGAISPAEVPILSAYLIEANVKKAETQGTSPSQDRPSPPVRPRNKDEAKEDPEVAGARILNTACTTCHDLGPVAGRTEDRASWDRIVNGMVGYGANVKDTEISVLVDYLFKHYGPPKPAPGVPEPIPSDIPLQKQ